MLTDLRADAISTILRFLDEIGIAFLLVDILNDTFLPGIKVLRGALVIDINRLEHPGDLLHEAGHLAVAPSSIRSSLSGEVVIPGTEPNVLEMLVMLWSYAACRHLKLDPGVVFHEGGYHGRSRSILNNFEVGVFLGVHELEAAGMTLSPADALVLNSEPFPAMQKWVRD